MKREKGEVNVVSFLITPGIQSTLPPSLLFPSSSFVPSLNSLNSNLRFARARARAHLITGLCCAVRCCAALRHRFSRPPVCAHYLLPRFPARCMHAYGVSRGSSPQWRHGPAMSCPVMSCHVVCVPASPHAVSCYFSDRLSHSLFVRLSVCLYVCTSAHQTAAGIYVLRKE